MAAKFLGSVSLGGQRVHAPDAQGHGNCAAHLHIGISPGVQAEESVHAATGNSSIRAMCKSEICSARALIRASSGAGTANSNRERNIQTKSGCFTSKVWPLVGWN